MRKWLLSVSHGMVELLYFLPVMLVMTAWLATPAQLSLWLVSIPVYYGLGNALVRLLRGRSRLLHMLAQFAVPLAVAYIWHGVGVAGLLYAATGIGAVLRGAKRIDRRIAQMLPAGVSLTSLLLYFMSSVFFRQLSWLEGYVTWIYAGGFATLALILFFTNREHLQAEADAGRKRQGTIRVSILRHNRIYTGIYILLIALIALYGPVTRFIAALWARVRTWLNQWLAREPESQPLDPRLPPAAMPPEFSGEIEEPSRWALGLERIMLVAFYVFLIVGAIMLMFWLVKGAVNVMRKLMAWLSERWNARDDLGDSTQWGYVDEKESLMDWDAWRQRTMKRIRDRLRREPRWEQLQSDHEKMRYLYKRWLEKEIRAGYAFKPHLTPNETKADFYAQKKFDVNREWAERVVDGYNETRYGGRPPASETLEKWKGEL